MKKYLLAILLLLIPLNAHAIVTYNCNGLTGGTSRDLDYLLVSDLSNNDRAIVVAESGSSVYYHYFRYIASGTTAENTATHPYYVRPDDYATSGVWQEVVSSWVDLGTDLTINDLTAINATISGTLTVNNVEASGALSGSLPVTDLADNTTHTLTGVSREGGVAHNYYAIGGSGCTVHLGDGVKGDSFIAALSRSTQVATGSGASIFVTWANTQTLLNQADFVTGTGAGTSMYYLSGTTGMGLTGICVADDLWYVYGDGSPSQETDF
jgi:hypothetical protein